MMRRVESAKYGKIENLRVVEVPIPKPRRGELLVRVHAIGVNPKDAIVRKGNFGVMTGRPPITLGHDLAGEVVEAPARSGYRAGDRVYGMVNDFSGRAYAEYVCISPDEIAFMPSSLSFEEAAAMPLAAQTALQALRDLGRVTEGKRVFIHGASGGVGTYAVQIARALGAEVTASSSAANRELCLELGAHHHVDYKEQPPSSLSGEYDVFFDVFGNQNLDAIEHALSERGVYINTLPNARVFKQVARTLFSKKKAKLVVVRSRARDLAQLAELAATGELKSIIAAVVPLSEVHEAHRLIETKRTRGKIILDPAR